MHASGRPVAFLTGAVAFTSDLPLAATAARLAEALSVPLAEDTEGIYEEIPAFYSNVLGLRVAISERKPSDQTTERHEYVLQVHPQARLGPVEYQEMDISPYLEALIRETPDFQIV